MRTFFTVAIFGIGYIACLGFGLACLKLAADFILH
jgi:hypothetical protein